ncbi:anthranilate synthase component II [Dictyoglomus turgidum]|uniref:anthranilate synthase component II n=1 Tax=Dictyoglomus turgidum TaxID=513050 RepID=UPI0023573741|nr:aminodeoxychorismate/anthranilate synthase component II [Dictyoglomus turgidum]
MLSPGPGRPTDDNILFEIIDCFKSSKKILGVCLGHQAIGVFFGLKLVKAQKPMHGIIDEIIHDEKGIFKNIKNPLRVVKYHSLILENHSNNDIIEIAACTKKGVQFHPESIGTEEGINLLKNFLRL